MYLSSENVYVFPSAIDRKDNFPYSKSFTEENIRKLITSAALWPSAILSCTDADGKDCSHKDIGINEPIKMEIMIDGYYVNVEFNPSSLLGSDTEIKDAGLPLYLAIVIDKTADKYPQLYGKDSPVENSTVYEFTGVQLVTDLNSITTPEDTKSYEKRFIQIMRYFKSSEGSSTVTKARCFLKNWKYQLDGGSYN